MIRTRGQDNNQNAKQQKQENNNPLSQLVFFPQGPCPLCSCRHTCCVVLICLCLFCHFLMFILVIIVFCEPGKTRYNKTRQAHHLPSAIKLIRITKRKCKGNGGGTGQDRNDQNGRRGHAARTIHARSFATQVWITMGREIKRERKRERERERENEQ